MGDQRPEGVDLWPAEFAGSASSIALHRPRRSRSIKGMTAFLIPLVLPGIEVRPIKQMESAWHIVQRGVPHGRPRSGFDAARSGRWRAGRSCSTTLGLTSCYRDPGVAGVRACRRVVGTARHRGPHRRHPSPGRPPAADAGVQPSSHRGLRQPACRRPAARRSTRRTQGSLGKLLWTEGMTLMSVVAASVLGARLTADGGDWGTYAWNDHVLGAPGVPDRRAVRDEETQRNIIGERVLGLPGEPRLDKSVPCSGTPVIARPVSANRIVTRRSRCAVHVRVRRSRLVFSAPAGRRRHRVAAATSATPDAARRTDRFAVGQQPPSGCPPEPPTDLGSPACSIRSCSPVSQKPFSAMCINSAPAGRPAVGRGRCPRCLDAGHPRRRLRGVDGGGGGATSNASDGASTEAAEPA